LLSGNGYIEGKELDGFLREFVSSVNNSETGPEVREREKDKKEREREREMRTLTGQNTDFVINLGRDLLTS
jgi:hypothetical protein